MSLHCHCSCSRLGHVALHPFECPGWPSQLQTLPGPGMRSSRPTGKGSPVRSDPRRQAGRWQIPLRDEADSAHPGWCTGAGRRHSPARGWLILPFPESQRGFKTVGKPGMTMANGASCTRALALTLAAFVALWQQKEPMGFLRHREYPQGSRGRELTAEKQEVKLMGVVRAGAQKARQGTQHKAKLRNSPSSPAKARPHPPPSAGRAATDCPVLSCPVLGPLLAASMCRGFVPLSMHPPRLLVLPPAPAMCPITPYPREGPSLPHISPPHIPHGSPELPQCGGDASAAQACSGHQPGPGAPLRPSYCAHARRALGRLPGHPGQRRCWAPVPAWRGWGCAGAALSRLTTPPLF